MSTSIYSLLLCGNSQFHREDPEFGNRSNDNDGYYGEESSETSHISDLTCTPSEEVESVSKRSSSPKRRDVSAREKLLRGVKKAKAIGKGLRRMEKLGVKGKMIEEDFWIEAVTKEHLSGKEARELFGVWLQNVKDMSFQEWIESNHIQKDRENVQCVTYLTDEEREKYVVSFGKDETGETILTREGVPYSTFYDKTYAEGEGTAMFVINSEKTLLAGSYVTTQFHHSSLASGAAIFGAGEITTTIGGTLTTISNRSGHYKPRLEQSLQTLQYLQDNGIDLSNVIYFDEINQAHYNAFGFLESKGTCIPIEKMDFGENCTHNTYC